jgi:hypothetical protein
VGAGSVQETQVDNPEEGQNSVRQEIQLVENVFEEHIQRKKDLERATQEDVEMVQMDSS